MIYYKIHRTQTTEVLAACDSELVNKKIVEGELELYITKEFYAEEKINKEEFKKMLKEYENINLFGKEAVEAAIETGLALRKNIKKIAGIPHLQIYIIE